MRLSRLLNELMSASYEARFGYALEYIRKNKRAEEERILRLIYPEELSLSLQAHEANASFAEEQAAPLPLKSETAFWKTSSSFPGSGPLVDAEKRLRPGPNVILNEKRPVAQQLRKTADASPEEKPLGLGRFISDISIIA